MTKSRHELEQQKYQTICSRVTEYLKASRANKYLTEDVLWWLIGKEPACNARETRDVSLIPGAERSPGEGNGNPLQYPCLENPRDRGAWQATINGS